MEFPQSKLLTQAVKQYFNENIFKFIKLKKEIVYFPSDCSDQMATLVFDYAKNKGVKCKLSKNKKGIYNLKVDYI